jgi:hypothetical protein
VAARVADASFFKLIFVRLRFLYTIQHDSHSPCRLLFVHIFFFFSLSISTCNLLPFLLPSICEATIYGVQLALINGVVLVANTYDAIHACRCDAMHGLSPQQPIPSQQRAWNEWLVTVAGTSILLLISTGDTFLRRRSTSTFYY